MGVWTNFVASIYILSFVNRHDNAVKNGSQLSMELSEGVTRRRRMCPAQGSNIVAI